MNALRRNIAAALLLPALLAFSGSAIGAGGRTSGFPMPGGGGLPSTLAPFVGGLKGFSGIPGDNGAVKLPVTLDADTMTFDEDSGVANAEGHVVVGMGTRIIEADRIRYDSRTGEAEFQGHVHYKSEGDEFSFERIVLNIDTELGILYNGTIHLATNNYRVSSERIEKTGPRTFFVRKGSLTTCDCDPVPDWNFEIGRSTVAIDGYAVGKDVIFKIRDYPVLWLPWAAFPVKLSRQSGFLTPGYVHSKTIGNGLSVPFYWAVNRWSDATITLEASDKRGFRPEAEYRYVLNPGSQGAIRGSYLHDRQTGMDLYRVFGENGFRKGAWTANGRWDLANNAAFYRDFVDTDLVRTARVVPSRFFVGRSGEGTGAALSTTWGKDIQGTPGADNTVQRLPELYYSVLPMTIGGTGVDASGAVAGTRFYRKDGGGELRGRGSVELSRPITIIPSVFISPFAGADFLESSSTGERTVQDGSGGRLLPEAGVRGAATLWRYFQTSSGGSLVHSVNPSFRFLWVPRTEQSDIPITDQWSRIAGRRQLTMSLAQALHRIGPDEMPVELARLELEWAMDFNGRPATGSPYVDPLSPFVLTLRDQIDLNAGRPKNSHSASDVMARLRFKPDPRWNVTGEMLFDPNDRRMTAASAGAEWKADKEHRASLEYRISRDLSEDLIGQAAVRIHRIVGLQASANYSIRNKDLTEGAATVTIYPRSDCWNVGFVVHRTTLPPDTSFRLVFGLRGIGNVGN
jgi:LPS-assembly protein